MIDEKKLIRWIKTNCNPYGNPTLDYETSIKIIKFIENNMEKVGEWIPCSEQMPPEPNANNTFDKKPVYLVSVNGEDYPYRALWNGRYFMDGFLILEAVAWMPLPEPYKAGD